MKLIRGFVIATAFLFAGGYASLVLLGSGISSVLSGKDDPFSFGQLALPGWGVVLTVATAIFFALAAARAGMSSNGRVRILSILGITLTTWFSGLVFEVITGLIYAGRDPLAAAIAGVFGYFSSQDEVGLIIFAAAAIAGWAYLGTLRWQARNAETRQFAHPED